MPPTHRHIESSKGCHASTGPLQRGPEADRGGNKDGDREILLHIVASSALLETQIWTPRPGSGSSTDLRTILKPHNLIHHWSSSRDSSFTVVLKQHWWLLLTCDADAMCGTTTALGSVASPGFISGSSSNTSRAARNWGCAFMCSTSATSSTTGPRLQFTRMAFWGEGGREGNRRGTERVIPKCRGGRGREPECNWCGHHGMKTET